MPTTTPPPKLSYVQVSSAYLLGLITASALFFYFQTPFETNSIQEKSEQYETSEHSPEAQVITAEKPNNHTSFEQRLTQTETSQEQELTDNSNTPEPKIKNEPNTHEFDVLPIQDPNQDQAPSRVEAMSTQFQNESHDANWAAAIESETWEKFYSDDLDGSDIQSVDCRSTLCKIVITHETEDASKYFSTRLLSQLNGAQGTMRSHVDDQGQLVTTIFRIR